MSEHDTFQELVREVSDHLNEAWPMVLQDWQEQVKAIDPKKRAVALVTRDCAECGTRVRVGAVMNRLSPHRPSGDRAFCATCRTVTHSPIVEVEGLAITD
jgi:hypothetical protein